MTRIFHTIKDDEGQRLDRFLKKVLPNSTYLVVYRFIRQGNVEINGRKVKNYKYELNESEQITVKNYKEEVDKKKHINIYRFKVLYEDNDLMVVDKESGIIVEKGREKKNEITLVDELRDYLFKKEEKVAVKLCNRLDRDTSGCMIIAKNKKTQDYFFTAFKNRKVKKTYLALVFGGIKQKNGIIKAPLYKEGTGRKKVYVDYKKGKESITKYKLIKSFPLSGDNLQKISLVEINLVTGRTHQIRVHFTYLGHPVVNDDQYGERKFNKLFKKCYKIKRLMLHASMIEFTHPVLLRKVTVKSKNDRILKTALKRTDFLLCVFS